MKKRILVLALGLALVTGVTACGKNEEDTTTAAVAEKTISLQQEIVNFVGTDLPGIAADRDAAVKIYNAYFAAGADQDSEKWMSTLSKDALPKYDNYLKNLRGLPYTHVEVGELRDLYVASAELQRGAIQDVIDAIKNVDDKLLTSAQKKVDDSRKKLDEYNKKLKELCDANQIKLEGLEKSTAEKTSEVGTGAAQQASTAAPAAPAPADDTVAPADGAAAPADGAEAPADGAAAE